VPHEINFRDQLVYLALVLLAGGTNEKDFRLIANANKNVRHNFRAINTRSTLDLYFPPQQWKKSVLLHLIQHCMQDG
jgi:hypothetical protein